MQHLAERFDFAAIAKWIHQEARLLDLGCGDGSLFQYLKAHRQVCGYGVELDPENVTQCIKKGISVLQLNLESGLQGFADDEFDFVIMSLSLQVVHRTELILKEMLRVGQQAIVSFPNFGYKDHRLAIQQGRMPVSKHLPFQWFNSPNVRFFTIDDFIALCDSLSIRQIESLSFAGDQPVFTNPNLESDVAIFRLGRG